MHGQVLYEKSNKIAHFHGIVPHIIGIVQRIGVFEYGELIFGARLFCLLVAVLPSDGRGYFTHGMAFHHLQTTPTTFRKHSGETFLDVRYFYLTMLKFVGWKHPTAQELQNSLDRFPALTGRERVFSH